MKSIFAKSPPAASSRHWVILSIVGAVILVIWLASGVLLGSGEAGVRVPPPRTHRIAIIADLDKRSNSGGGQWHSKYMTGTLSRRDDNKYTLEWDDAVDVFTSHNEAGRGCELSELLMYRDKLYTYDDRTGIMFEVLNAVSGKPALAPRGIYMEGAGATDKGLKIEWATVKDGDMYIGSFGKEFTNNAGEIVHKNNLWVVVRHPDGSHEQVDWTPHYSAMRKALGYETPGYLLHEAIIWSPIRRQWFIFPRRASTEVYDEKTDEQKGANLLIIANEDFSKIESTIVGEIKPRRGFSSVKFLPGTRDTVVIALKSEENSESDSQTTYFTMYEQNPDGHTWRVVFDETEIDGGAKFEGLEVLRSTQ